MAGEPRVRGTRRRIILGVAIAIYDGLSQPITLTGVSRATAFVVRVPL